MVETAQIAEIAEKVARSNLKPEVVEKVFAKPSIDSEGREALQITIVIKPDTAARLDGDALLDTLVQIQDRLHEAGEERFAIVEYATEAELEAGDDPQS
jgi:hypothetical protein